MNKAVPWNISGVGFDAREAARESARRQGKSLGEWLHSVIADHADELGVAARDVADQDRIAAVTAKLERLSGRNGSGDRRPGRHREDGAPRTRMQPRELAPDDVADDDDLPRIRRSPTRRDPDLPTDHRRAHRAPALEETEFLLEEAIDAMERRAMRSQRRTDDALASLARLLETNEAKRDRERDAVRDLSEKLSDIDAKLSARTDVADATPIKGALAQLEARLERIGQRSATETAAFEGSSPVKIPVDDEQIRRLEDKLSSILDAVAQKPKDVAPVAESSPIHRRLGEAIAEISRRQQSLDAPDASIGRSASSRDQRPLVVRGAAESAPWQRSLAEMQVAIAGLATKIEEMRYDVVRRGEGPAPGYAELDGLRAEIGSMSQTLRELAPRETVTQLQGSIDALTRRIETSRERGTTESSALLAQNLEGTIQTNPETQSDVVGLEGLVRDLRQKIEATQAPGADGQSVEALQKQIELLAKRFARSEDGLASLASLKDSMKDLFAHLEATRAKVEASAAAAAREALKTALDQGDGTASRKGALDVDALKALQRDADARTQTTLNAVHQTLDHVVGRMSVMETELARRGSSRPVAEPSPPKGNPVSKPTDVMQNLALGAPDPLREPLFAPRTIDRDKASAGTKRAQAGSDEEAGRADFIAAARRAAQIAQSDPSVSAGAPMRSGDDTDARAGLLAKSRDYVATHKRPVLLSVAAVFVVLGTMAIVQRMTFDGGDDARVVAESPAKTVQMASSAVQPVSDTQSPTVAATAADLTPSALPKGARAVTAQIPGSDPIETGSIQSLPSFAAQAAAPSPGPGLPAGLTAKAQAGDGAAEYELASRYADGKTVPRDLKLAAQWYAKAADQGLAPAQYHLAALYEKGLGVAKDKVRAKTLYEQAANAGNPRAMHNLAVLLADGDGKPDYAGAASWFRKAAQYGVHDSQYNLAILLARGLGVNQSLVQSYQWFSIAAAQGDSDAAKKRDEVGDKLSANDLAVAKALANSFQPRAPNVTATNVAPPPGGWDGVGGSSQINSARSKISSL